MAMQSYEKLGAFYLGRRYDLAAGEPAGGLLLYDSKDLVTHAVCIGMTGSGKTGLCVGLLEEAAIDGIPAIVIDPKGDLGNLLLTFPELRPEDFRPWVNEDDARRQGVDADTYAAHQAELWRRGLGEWEQDGERIRRLREAADFAIYTPGSEAGLPVSILASFAAPGEAVVADQDLFRDRISSTVTSLLGLIGVQADPIRSREHILLSTLLDNAWRGGTDADLAGLIQGVQRPPFEQVGVLDLESFYPARERFELAMLLNNLLAAPGFQTWMSGESLDVGRLLYTPSGKPRVAIFSIAHLSEAERMFFVSLLLNQTLSWMRTRPGTTSLRALLYMDEIFGYMPPVAEPPSKKPILTLLKQARAFGVGVVLATQNPVDLDYKGLSNTGTWFLGRLQTERDKARVLDGLEGVGGGAVDRKSLETTLSGLGKRKFLLHNVHEPGPVVFESRWVMSYLRGPLTRDQIRLLTPAAARPAEVTAPPPPAAPAAAAAPAAPAPARSTAQRSAPPVVPAEVEQVFLPTRAAGAVTYEAGLVGLGRVEFVDRKSKATLRSDEVCLYLPVAGDELDVDWREAEELELAADELEREPAGDAGWGPLPGALARAGGYKGWGKELSDTLYRTRSLELFESPTFKLVSEPGESERDFRIRLADLAREARDEEVDKLRKRHASKAKTLEDRLLRAKQKVEREQTQASQQKLQTAISIGATLLGALTGRKALSTSTLGRATTALRGAGRSSSEAADVARAQESVEALTEQIEALNAELETEIDQLDERFDPEAEKLETVAVRPRRSDVEVRLVALGWRPTAG